MVDYEKGSPAWDISMMITRHEVGCARRQNLRDTVASGYSAEGRMRKALATTCTCGMGDSPAESTSMRGRWQNDHV